MVLASPAWADTIFTVNSDADTDGSACITGPSSCTLREAINAVNAASGDDEIVFDLGQKATITLAT